MLVFLYTWFLKAWAELLAWIAIILVGSGIFGLGFAVKYWAENNYAEGETTQKALNASAYIIWVLFGIYMLMVCCLYYSIKISIKVLKVAAKVLMRNLHMIIVPISMIIIMGAWIALYIYALLYLMTVGKVTEVSETYYGVNVYSYFKFEWSTEEKYYIWFSLFYFFWVAALLVAATQYIIIVAVASWYFTQSDDKGGDFSLCRGLWWTLRYNLGSLMFGSFLMAVVWMIRTIFEYI